jgi:xanthine/CO dehydrogenase XdhC/CoxF family maturation factor
VKQWLETRQVFAQAAALHRDGVPAALATVIRVRGSAYRHEGAKLILADDGRGAGNVSGGCLEEDVREVAHRVIATGVAERRAYCGGANEVAAWDLGVGCEGEVDILIEPVRDDFAVERGLIEAEVPFVVITRLDTQARLAVTGEEAREWLEDGRSQLVTREDAELFIDVMVPPPRLLVVSAGHDARHLARLADEVGFRVVVADRRPGLLAPERFPSSVRLVETDAARLSERVVLDDTSYAVVMTHHFADDTEYVRALLRGPVRYVGLLGPRQRTERILATLRAEGPVDDSRIYGPVGLDIGTDGAEQVALSVLAEILAVRSGRGARSLRERKAPIHAGR